jgi:hypothetical protein
MWFESWWKLFVQKNMNRSSQNPDRCQNGSRQKRAGKDGEGDATPVKRRGEQTKDEALMPEFNSAIKPEFTDFRNL